MLFQELPRPNSSLLAINFPSGKEKEPDTMNKVDALREAFFYFDNNHAGTIHIDELHDIVTRNGEAMPDVNEFLDEAAKFADGSGNVDYNSFAQLMYSED